MSARRVLVLSALPEEAAHVPDGVEVVVIGLGKSVAAVSAMEALLRRPTLDGIEVWNVGTAGALRDGLEGVHTPGRVLNHDINGDAIRLLGIDPQDVLDVEGGDHTVLATGDVFVSDPVTRERLAERAHLVDMEGYAVTLACQRLGVPVRLVKHVSDNADDQPDDWQAMVDASARALGAWLEQNLPG